MARCIVSRPRWALLLGAAVLLGILGCDSDEGAASRAAEGGEPLDPGTAAELSIRLSTCTGATIDEQWGDAVVAPLFQPVPEDAIRCVLEADDCDGVLACLGAGAPGCDPSAATTCADGETITVCQEYENGLVREETRACSQESPDNPACVEDESGTMCVADTCDTDARECRGDVLTRCSGGLLWQLDCARMGLLCVDAGGRARCDFSDQDCGSDRCEGDVLVECDEIVSNRLDCTIFGQDYTCGTDDDDVVCRVPAESAECSEGESACEGSVARVCFGGAWVAFDCSGFLGGNCLETPDGVRCKLRSWQ